MLASSDGRVLQNNYAYTNNGSGINETRIFRNILTELSQKCYNTIKCVPKVMLEKQEYCPVYKMLCAWRQVVAMLKAGEIKQEE